MIEWCRAVADNEVTYQRLKAVRDLVLQQRNRLEDFAAEFVREA